MTRAQSVIYGTGAFGPLASRASGCCFAWGSTTAGKTRQKTERTPLFAYEAIQTQCRRPANLYTSLS